VTVPPERFASGRFCHIHHIGQQHCLARVQITWTIGRRLPPFAKLVRWTNNFLYCGHSLVVCFNNKAWERDQLRLWVVGGSLCFAYPSWFLLAKAGRWQRKHFAVLLRELTAIAATSCAQTRLCTKKADMRATYDRCSQWHGAPPSVVRTPFTLVFENIWNW